MKKLRRLKTVGWVLFLFLGVLIYGCGGDSGTSTEGSSSGGGGVQYGSASLVGTVGSGGSKRAVRADSNLTQGVVSLVVDLDGDGTFGSSGDKTYHGVIQSSGEFSLLNVQVKKESSTQAKLTIEKNGCAPYEKIVELSAGDSVKLSADVSPVEKTTVTIKHKRDGGYIIFGIKDSPDGTKKIFAKRATRADDAVNATGTKAQVAIPVDSIPDNVEELTASMRLFDSGNSKDIKQFPGEFKGTGYPATKSDDKVVQLKSIAFLYADFTDQDGKKVDFEEKKNRQDGTCSNLEVVLNVPDGQISQLTDDVPGKGQYDVPIWRYNPDTGMWEFITEGELYYSNGTAVEDSATSLTGSGFYVKGCLPPGWTYCNLDYGVWFGQEPKEITVCIKAMDQNNNPIPRVWMYAEGKSDNAGNTYVDSSTDNSGLAKIQVSIPGDSSDILKAIKNNYEFSWEYYAYGWIANEIDLSNLTDSELSGCDYYMDLQIQNPFDSQIKVTVKDQNGNPIKDEWVTVDDGSNYYDAKMTDGNGEVLFDVKSNTLYYIYALGQEKRAKVDKEVDLEETSDNGQLVSVDISKPEDIAPEVYIQINPAWGVKPGSMVTAYIYASDVDSENLSLTDAQFNSESVVESCSEIYSYYGYAAWQCSLDTTGLSGSTTFNATVSDGKKSTSQLASIDVISNRSPQVYGIDIKRNGNYVWDWNALKVNTSYTFTAYAWDPDGDTLSYTWNVSGGDCTTQQNSVNCTFNSEGNYTIKTIVNDGEFNATYSIDVHVGNQAPIIYAFGTSTVDPKAGDQIDVFAYAYDPDSGENTALGVDNFTWKVDGLTANATEADYDNSTGYYTGKLNLPSDVPLKGYFDVTLVVTDAYGKKTSDSFKVWVSAPSDLPDVTTTMADFLNNPTDENFTTLLNVINSLPETKETHLWRATATLLKLYQDNQSFFDTLGLNLDSTLGNLNPEDIFLNLLRLADYDQELKGVLDDLLSKLDTVLDDLQDAEGVNTNISVTGFDTIYFDDFDVKSMEAIVKAVKAICLYIESLDLTVSNWTVDGEDIRDLIESGQELSSYQLESFMTNNQNLFTYIDTLKLQESIEAFKAAVDKYDEILNNLSDDYFANRRKVQHAIFIDNNSTAQVWKQILDSFKVGIDDQYADIKMYIEEYVGKTMVHADDDNYYIQELYNIGVMYFKPADSDFTLYHVACGEKTLRDVIMASLEGYDLYVVDSSRGEEIIGKNVPEIDWSNPIDTTDTYEVPIADITVDGDASDWNAIPVFRTVGNTEIKIARSSDSQYFYVYARHTNQSQGESWKFYLGSLKINIHYGYGILYTGYSGEEFKTIYYEFEDGYSPDWSFSEDFSQVTESNENVSEIEAKFTGLDRLLQPDSINGLAYYEYKDYNVVYDKAIVFKLLPEISTQ